MAKIITSSAPGKLMLFGEHAVVYEHPCIVTAVDERIFVSISENGQGLHIINDQHEQNPAYIKNINEVGNGEIPKSVALLEHLYKRFLQKYPQQTGLTIKTTSEFSSLFGFGSSSAVTVAFAYSLNEFYGLKLSNHQLFDLCYQAVIDVQGVGSGFDLAAAIWGGTIYYVSSAKVVEKINVNLDSFFVGYTGIKADTAAIVKRVKQEFDSQPQRFNSILSEIHQIVDKAKTELASNNLPAVGELMNQNQDLLRQLNVSSPELENLISATSSIGALGAKLSGAGGGDCMIGVIDNENRPQLTKAINDSGGQVMNVKLNAQGARLEL